MVAPRHGQPDPNAVRAADRTDWSCQGGKSKFENYDKVIGRINGEKMWVLRIKAELEMVQQSQAALERRIEEINAALLQERGMIEEYDDIRTRQLLISIKVPDKRRLIIRLKDGTEIMQTV